MWIDKNGNPSPGWIMVNVAEEGEEPRYLKCVNPTPEQYIAAGWHWEEPPAPEPPDMTEFNNACAQFRTVCGQIAEAAELPGFKGGFEEMPAFRASPVFATVAGLQLAMAWSAANDLCVYEGAKVGLGQPEWWYECWRQVEPEPSESEGLTDND